MTVESSSEDSWDDLQTNRKFESSDGLRFASAVWSDEQFLSCRFDDFLKLFFFFGWGKTQVWKPMDPIPCMIYIYIFTDIYHKNQPFMLINMAVPWMSPWMVWESVCCYRLRHIRCAYEYGVPQASGQFYSGDGPYDGGVWDAERHLVDPWKLGKDGQFLGCGFHIFFLIVYPENWGKLIQIDFAHMFQMGWNVQPPPRFGIILFSPCWTTCFGYLNQLLGAHTRCNSQLRCGAGLGQRSIERLLGAYPKLTTQHESFSFKNVQRLKL